MPGNVEMLGRYTAGQGLVSGNVEMLGLMVGARTREKKTAEKPRGCECKLPQM